MAPATPLPAPTERSSIDPTEPVRVGLLLLPLVGGAVFHGVCIRFDWLKALARPIDGGRTFRGRRLFGAHKTFRGVVAVSLGTSVFMFVQQLVWPVALGGQASEVSGRFAANGLLLGFALGAGAMLSELPNSFVKRQLDIAPGASGRGPLALLFYVLDQIDLLLGAWVALAFVLPITGERVVWSIVIVAIVHQWITRLGDLLGLRRGVSRVRTR
jgi:hypothetical protein